VVEPEAEWNLLDPDVLRWLLERKFSLRLLAEFTEMRLGIEPAAAALAARNADEAGLEGIRKGLRMKAAAGARTTRCRPTSPSTWRSSTRPRTRSIATCTSW
jgi:DNA-binding FadR family transcriptional regulator